MEKYMHPYYYNERKSVNVSSSKLSAWELSLRGTTTGFHLKPTNPTLKNSLKTTVVSWDKLIDISI